MLFRPIVKFQIMVSGQVMWGGLIPVVSAGPFLAIQAY